MPLASKTGRVTKASNGPNGVAYSNAVIVSTYVWSVSHGNDPLRSEGHFLPSDANDRIDPSLDRYRQSQVDKRLLDVYLVDIRWGGVVLSRRQVACYLDERPRTVPEVQVGMQKQAVQGVAVGRLTLNAEVRCRIVFEALPKLTAQTQPLCFLPCEF